MPGHDKPFSKQKFNNHLPLVDGDTNPEKVLELQHHEVDFRLGPSLQYLQVQKLPHNRIGWVLGGNGLWTPVIHWQLHHKKHIQVISPMHDAAHHRNVQSLRNFLADDFDPNAIFSSWINGYMQQTALHAAIIGFDGRLDPRRTMQAVEVIQLLLDNNADPHLADRNGVSAYDLAQKTKDPALISAFESHKNFQRVVDVEVEDSSNGHRLTRISRWNDNFGPKRTFSTTSLPHFKPVKSLLPAEQSIVKTLATAALGFAKRR